MEIIILLKKPTLQGTDYSVPLVLVKMQWYKTQISNLVPNPSFQHS